VNRSEIRIAIAALAIIVCTGLALAYGKPRLGQPGLVLEQKPLTNEVGAVVTDQRVFFPTNADEFSGSDAPVGMDELKVLPSDTTFGRKLYRDRGGFMAQMTAVLMKTDRTSIHRPQTCVTGQGWVIENTETISIPVAIPHAYNLRATALQIAKQVRGEDGATHELRGWYIFWFVAEDELTPRLGEAHLSIAKNLLLAGKLQRWAYVSCFSYGQPAEAGVRLARMKRLISATAPEFQTVAGGPQQTASLAPATPLK
jgi:hypothetical protein